MALIKRIDVDKYFSAKRAMKLRRLGLTSQTVTAGTVPAGKAAKAPGLIDTRTREGSSPGVSATSIPMVAGSRASVPCKES
jgi:hypothetical protein